MLRLRVELPDRPGSLSELSRTIAAAGGDIAQLIVMERAAGMAVDDVWVALREPAAGAALLGSVADLPAVGVLGYRNGAALIEFDAQLDALAYLFAAPQRGAEAFIDMLPTVVDADWAAIRSSSSPVGYDSDLGDDVSRASPIDALAEIPLSGEGVVIVGRNRDLPWHAAEVRRLTSVLELAALLIRQTATATKSPLTPVTSWLIAEGSVAAI